MTIAATTAAVAELLVAAAGEPAGDQDATQNDEGAHPLATAFYLVVAVGALIYLVVTRRKPKTPPEVQEDLHEDQTDETTEGDANSKKDDGREA